MSTKKSVITGLKRAYDLYSKLWLTHLIFLELENVILTGTD